MNQNLVRTRVQLAADFHELEQLFADLVNRCSREQLVWRPAGGSWSIAQCIEHVARTNSQYLVSITAAIAKGGRSAKEQNDVLSPAGMLSAAFLKRIGPNVTTKFKTPRKIRPVSIDPDEAFLELRRGHAEILELLSVAQSDFNRIRFRNPFIPVLRFTVATALLAMAAHGLRHFQQADRLTRMDSFPKNKAHQSA
jgi:hypothetical protein